MSNAISKARTLRGNPTPAEKKLWEKIRQEQLGVRFRRQVPLGPYFADFACIELKLVIEVDGEMHSESRTDAVRTKYLRDSVLRLSGSGTMTSWRILKGSSTDSFAFFLSERINRANTARSTPTFPPHACFACAYKATVPSSPKGEEIRSEPHFSIYLSPSSLPPLGEEGARASCAGRWGYSAPHKHRSFPKGEKKSALIGLLEIQRLFHGDVWSVSTA